MHDLQNLGWKYNNTAVQTLRPILASSATECDPKVINNSSRNFPLTPKACKVNQLIFFNF